MKTLTAVLFAGGESSRMGMDKALLTWNGEPLWSRQIGILRELHPARLMISAKMTNLWHPADIDIVLDAAPSRGPLSGLVAALKKIQTTHLLALAVDLPQMTSVHLRKLWALARPRVAVIPHSRDCIEPLCAIYPVEALAPARKALFQEDVSLRGLVRSLAAQKRLRFCEIKKPEIFMYQNVNTPEQWLRMDWKKAAVTPP